jgi:hypothetical protein
MSSQNILKNTQVVLWSLFVLRWVFMIASIYTVYQIYLEYSLLNSCSLIIFIYFTGQFYILEKVFHRQKQKEFQEATDEYNETVESVNSKSRKTRRAIIRNMTK